MSSQEEEEEEEEQPKTDTAAVVVAPARSSLSSSWTRFNFGPASTRDTILYTAERPGNAFRKHGQNQQQQNQHQQDVTVPPPAPQKIPTEKALEWIDYMKAQKIHHVIALLDDNELQDYQEEPGLVALYQAAGMTCHVEPMKRPGSVTRILQHIQNIKHSNNNNNQNNNRHDKIVVHCTGGVGRAGRVAAAWLVQEYGLTPQDATAEVLQVAAAHQVKRKGNASMLQEWMEQYSSSCVD